MSHSHPHNGPTDQTPPAALVRAELDRILASEVFSRSDRLSAFLTFIVEQALDGHGDSLKEQVLASEVYGKRGDFNTAADPIVRVDARRLRDKLREYYASAHRPVVISVPKGSYAPVFEVAPLDTVAPIDAKPRAPRRWWTVPAAVVAIGGAAWLATSLRIGPQSTAPPLSLHLVTSFPGAEEDPSFSPDGNFVAFSWHGRDAFAPADIWVKAVDGDALRRLTDTPDMSETWPAWSPDGRQIVFTRWLNGSPSILLVSALGGPPQMIAERGAQASWLPDGRSLVMTWRTADRFGLIHHVIATGERRALTVAPVGSRDVHPRVSPDGKTLAFARVGVGGTALFLMPLSGGHESQRTEWTGGFIGGLTWTPDGREIVFAEPHTSGRRLVRIPASGSDAPPAVAGLPLEAVSPATSRAGPGKSFRLALSYGLPDVGLRLIDLRAPRRGPTIIAVTPFCDATRIDMPGRFSPDGTSVAFTSDRGGSPQVWVAGRDGSNLHSLTTLTDAIVVLGSWSPDGRRVAFDATIAGNTDIYVVSVDGGPLTRVTEGRASETDPEWSRDGRSIYYASNESGRYDIWKMSAAGGQRVRLTSEGGAEPRVSPDGRSIYFHTDHRQSSNPVGTVRSVSIDGGPTFPVQAGVRAGAWHVTDAGIVFVVSAAGLGGTSREPDALAFYDFAERRVRRIGELTFRATETPAVRFLAVSRDGRWVLASNVDRWDRDILVADGLP
jgi:Tol biopolymer transport system component